MEDTCPKMKKRGIEGGCFAARIERENSVGLEWFIQAERECLCLIFPLGKPWKGKSGKVMILGNALSGHIVVSVRVNRTGCWWAGIL